ncbi:MULTISPECIES: RHS repeat-associated core domain-containing protein [unclassified Pseudomonas]|uniref:RHS repeat-associated core domain-containing protein n=1 Tax=unclassified Pseudomonas TaxID=196821 RepID=UPI000876D3BD|nr:MULTISPECIES: RHS repeat-associated core domain-containing protein [unclassified Pseudomonas]SCZ34003.1 RHS repeat-associated core domain-containing protein [Pseudomonas sp. NFACC44-2]SDA58636.1 RHS repeat-associated core domain-containing protein [Pseudomonas sp. NFACC51]SEJ62940.1 RHS repeat-associated core domain-containing protein [Pseudomonas sp. NFACC07-1]SFH72949.1 RHS repeat-associated core domain-containing protein [Pseudomonas sp. NFACC54]SFS68132.1 RHS repeat-associated core doma
MSTSQRNSLCYYRYDPLDRLVECRQTAQTDIQRFYLKDRLTSEIQGAKQRSIFQLDDHLLALQKIHNGVLDIALLTTDLQRSVLHALDATGLSPLAYTPYGHRVPENGLLSLLGFNGERPDPVTGHYLLGNGYRAFNPVLMRFNSPDSLSPFGKGGLNAYTYCDGDPLNRRDPTGHFFFPKGFNPIKGLRNLLGQKKSPHKAEAPSPTKQYAVGYHGTTDSSAQNLLNRGVLDGYAGANSKPEDLVLGEGFYIATDPGVAEEYARSLLSKSERTVVLKVYVTDMPSKALDIDYYRGEGMSEGIKSLRPHIYEDISFKYHGSFRRNPMTVQVNQVRQ